MVAMAIVALLLSIGVPSYRYVTNANRIASEVNGLLGDLQLARAQAIKQGLPVTVCVANTAGTACGGGTSWKAGWITYVDSNVNGSFDVGEPILKVQKTFTSTDTFNATNSVTAVTFNRSGIAVGIVNGTVIKLQDTGANTKWTRCLVVVGSGLASVQPYGGTFNGVTCS